MTGAPGSDSTGQDDSRRGPESVLRYLQSTSVPSVPSLYVRHLVGFPKNLSSLKTKQKEKYMNHLNLSDCRTKFCLFVFYGHSKTNFPKTDEELLVPTKLILLFDECLWFDNSKKFLIFSNSNRSSTLFSG